VALGLTSFAGGAMAIAFLSLIPGISPKPSLSDAISIANTYIVFTTIIFVGTTLLLALLGYVFTQQFSEHKETQTQHLLSDLKEKFREDSERAIDFVNVVLENRDVQRHIEEKFRAKLDELVNAKKVDADRHAEVMRQVKEQLGPNGVSK
jgi:hypothetical protein